MIICIIATKPELKELLDKFLKVGGKVNSFYLKKPSKGPALVFYKRWYRGRNVKDAITRALAAS